MAIKVVLANFVTAIINPLITLLFSAAMLLFIWGLFQFMIDLQGGGDGKGGKQHMLWGMLGITIMFSVGGILNLIVGSLPKIDTDKKAPSKIEIKGGFK